MLLNSYHFVLAILFSTCRSQQIKKLKEHFSCQIFVQYHHIFLMQVWQKNAEWTLKKCKLAHCSYILVKFFIKKIYVEVAFDAIFIIIVREIIIFLVKHIRCLQCFLYVCQEVGVGKAASLARDLHLF